jgi:endopeptidase Clp ATP-binding regulatory subunit ClpX
MKPRELEAYLDEYVVRQDRAKEILATKICTHFNRIRLLDASGVPGTIKNNIIMIGPTGVGKTFLIKLIARKIGVPFVKGDATKFSETGYVGGDVEDLVRDLVSEAGGDIELAQYGIIYIDEIDKIAGSKNAWGLDVSRTGVQRALLKPMEETEIDLKVPHDMVSQMEAVEQYRRTGKREKRVINTRNILFIVSGAFSGLDGIIQDRLCKQAIGFGSSLRSSRERESLLPEVKAEDLVTYGFESEFIGRLPVVATFDLLSADDLYAILKNPNSSVINSKKRDFMAYGIDIRFEDEALRELARCAETERTGARGLVSAVERVLLKFEKALPSTDVRRLVVDRDMVLDPAAAFERFMRGDDRSDMDMRHGRLVAAESAELKRRLQEMAATLDAAWRPFVQDACVDTIVKITVSRYLDYRRVLEDAARTVGQIRRFESEFCGTHAIEIHFDEGACTAIIEDVLMGSGDSRAYLHSLFENYQHGLKLIKDRTGRHAFVFTAEAIRHPQEYLNELIKASYK